ncbi:autotransporter outer membrane beta-barrel domain-containing protein, partial [Fusobacterium mortiferum]|uniref:autotransporter outer membrane beta-barrel domain-containing protein n=1 Tax=Fusobacterium mortiferum TaxID=850 RepID=UPI001F48FF3B
MKRELEKSLKRYLKRKVRITLGFVTAFAIMGNVGLANSTTDYELAEKYLNGIENTKLDEKSYENGNYQISVDSVGKLTLTGFIYQDNGKDVLNNIKISTETKKILDDSLAYFVENGVISISDAWKESENLGVVNNDLNNGQQYGGDIVNKGIMVSQSIGQQSNWANFKKLENYGLIIVDRGRGDGGAQAFTGGDNSTLLNYGTILSNGNGQLMTAKSKNGLAYNYGYIYSKSYGQEIQNSTNGQAYNFGIIDSELVGQHIKSDATNGVVKNNGEINVVKNTGIGQHIVGDTNIGYNYGLINVNDGIGIKTETNGQAYNNGVIKIDDETKAFSGDNIINNGIVIVNKESSSITDTITTAENNGVILDKDYNLVNGKNDNVTSINNGDTINNSSASSNYLKDGQATISENLVDKTLNTVVTETSNLNSSVFTYNGKEDLNLVNTDITGYFEKGGTLLEVGGGADLILAGDSQITAVKNNITDTDIVAVKINDGGNLAIAGTANVNGKIEGVEGRLAYLAANSGAIENSKIAENIEVKSITVENATDYLINNGGISQENNYTNLTFRNTKVEDFNINFETTAEGIKNKIVLEDSVEITNGINGQNTKEGNDLYLEINNIDKIGGDILLGAGNDEISIEKNLSYENKIDLGAGEDTLVLKHANESDTEHKKTEENTFNYNVMNTENINLVGGHWHIEDAHIGFDEASNSANINILGREDGTKDGELHVEINSLGIGQGVESSLDGIVDEGTDLTITANGGIKYVVGDNFNVYQDNYIFDTDYKIGSYENKEGELVETEIKGAVIFDVTHETKEDGTATVNLRVKDASEFGLEKYTAIYDTVLANLTQNKELTDAINYYNDSKFINMIKGTDNKASAFYTTGYAVTKDVTDMYMDTVESFGRKAGAGEWLAFGKYLSSDTEFDGGSSSRGYDGDITGTVGMLEYGVNDTTSYGVVFGKGDTKVDINGGGKLDGDNTYVGGYVKHTTEGGIELLGNIGFTKSDLDAKFNSFTSVGDVDYSMISDGSSNADAITLSLKAKKPYSITETLRVEPMLGARYTLINQDAVESSDMNFRIDARDVTVLEGMAGADLVKDFSVANGKLSLKTGVEVSLLSVSDSDDARYTLYGNEIALVNEE